jgi:hypothetical protein
MTPTTIIHRYPGGLVLTCEHPEPAQLATWTIERVVERECAPASHQWIDGHACDDMAEALKQGVAAVERVST